MCVLCTALLSWLFYLSGQSSEETLFAFCGQCLVPCLIVRHFKKVCSGLFVNETCHNCHQNSPVRRCGVSRGLASLVGDGAHITGTEASITGRGGFTGAWEWGMS